MEDNRLEDPRMDWYKEVYKDSKRLKYSPGFSIRDKKVIVYGEQGLGDIIQFARYIQPLKETLNCDVIFHCPKDFHRLFACLDVELLDKESDQLPDHDYHILSFDLPFVIRQVDAPSPYITCPETEGLDAPEDVKKIGIAWEGNPNHTNAGQRDCPLRYFKMFDVEGIQLYCLQKAIHNGALLDGCQDMNLYSVPINDFYDTAKLINAMDMVISVDTSVLHLAGAMDKLTYAILAHDRDPRWDIRQWYHWMICVRQNKPNDWPACFRSIVALSTGTLTDSVSQRIDIDKDMSDMLSD